MPEDNIKGSTHLFGDGVSHWLWTCQAELPPLILPPSLQHWNYKCAPPYLAFFVVVQCVFWGLNTGPVLSGQALSSLNSLGHISYTISWCVALENSFSIRSSFGLDGVSWDGKNGLGECRSKDSHCVTSPNQDKPAPLSVSKDLWKNVTPPVSQHRLRIWNVHMSEGV